MTLRQIKCRFGFHRWLREGGERVDNTAGAAIFLRQCCLYCGKVKEIGLLLRKGPAKETEAKGG